MFAVVAAALSVSEEQRVELGRMAGSSVLPHRQVVQAKALLWAADGVANEEIARRVGVDSDTVRRWRKVFSEKGIAGVGAIAKGRGRKPWLPAGTVERVLEVTAHETPPGGATHWTTRSLAARGRGGQGHRGADLGRPQPQAVAGDHLQNQQRSSV